MVIPLPADGIVIDMLPFKAMKSSADGRVLTVQARFVGCVIPFLNEHGRSVAIMQSDSSFSGRLAQCQCAWLAS